MVFSSRNVLSVFCLLSALFIASCGGDSEEEPITPEPSDVTTVTIDPTVNYQEMVGFGGALTWYSDRLISSNKKAEIADLLFTDLGTDIIRLKNWYYPDNYPAVKSTDAMSDDNSKLMWNITNELYSMSQDGDPNIEVLLSSWGPPPSLKDNNNTRQGTLKKDVNGKFMYRAFGEYWKDLLDNLPFDPEYASIQNEPTFVTAGWTTCQWAAFENFDLPGYDKALDSVYEQIKTIPNAPMLIGPESANIGEGSAGNTFTTFAERLKNNEHVGMFAYHPYNFNSGSSANDIASKLQLVKGYSGKPNIMTEYSDNLAWHATAKFINSTLSQGNTSGYIYWKMVWAKPASGPDHALISIADNGTYTVTPYYYVMKHFAKYIAKGYKRVKVSSSNTNISMTAFMNPEEDQLTVILVNTGGAVKIKPEATGKTITGTLAIQSTEGNFYKELNDTSEEINLPAESVTTLVLDL